MSNITSSRIRTLLMATAATAALALAMPGFDGAHAADSDAGHVSGGHSGGSGGKGGSGKGKSMKGLFHDVTGAAESDSDSDAPDWAGVKGGKSGGGGKPMTAGAKKGDLFGDLYVILRDDAGVPILSDAGFVQPIDEAGNLIPLDAEGAPIDATLTQEVELGRLNVGRAPTKVLDRRADEVVALLASATAVTVDAAGRLVLTVDGVASTIDSPLENLAMYVALVTTGTIPGVTDLPGTEYDFLVDGQLTAADLTAAASFLAAATDKSGAFTTDEIAYIDAFLGINLESAGDVTWSVVDYTTFTYDRSDTYADATASVLVMQADGSYLVETVNIYDTVFGGEDLTASGTLAAFTDAADDARAVINFVHEYAVPAATTN